MIELLQIAQGIVERGLLFGTLVAAVFAASRLIRFDNLAVEGAFSLGGAVIAFLASMQVHPWIALVGACAMGGVSGIVTGVLNTKLKLNGLISGIVVTTGLFSIVLKIAGSHMSLGAKDTIFTLMPSCMAPYQALILLAFLSVFLFSVISWFLKTEVGLLLHVVGDAPQVITSLGKNVHGYKIMGLVISNALAAFAGALFVQYTGYFSVWTSVGMLVIGLAGMILAETLSMHFGYALLVGSIMYQGLLAFTFELQLDQDWNKLITALLIVCLLMVRQAVHERKVLSC